MARVEHHYIRQDGSEVKVVAQPSYSAAGLRCNIDLFVLHRKSSQDGWRVASDRPHPNWRTMSVADYVAHGRPETLTLTSFGERVKASHEARKLALQ